MAALAVYSVEVCHLAAAAPAADCARDVGVQQRPHPPRTAMSGRGRLHASMGASVGACHCKFSLHARPLPTPAPSPSLHPS